MFEDVGKKIMMLAKVSFWVDIVGIAIVFFMVMLPAAQEYDSFWHEVTYNSRMVSLFLLICVAAGFATWVMNWFLYGIGQLVDDVHSMAHSTKQTADQLAAGDSGTSATVSTAAAKNTAYRDSDIPQI